MKGYHIYFIVLKLLLIIQLILVFCKKMSQTMEIYIISDTIFKISVGAYLLIFFNMYTFPGLDYEDTIILRFSGMILLWDIDFGSLLKIIRRYIPSLPRIALLEKKLA